ncbi:MAG: hydrogenase maturation protease [Anaerolineaceae bacterium]|nr:hydrogenase maturation protease [Anaerolineaceae bacterium]
MNTFYPQSAAADPRILVAGIGNIFHGDDIFGVTVARELASGDLPAGVQVTDFGIRSYDLAYAMLDDYDATILVDATAQGGAPGTLYLIEPDLDDLDQFAGLVVDSHSMNPMTALQLVKSFGGRPSRLYLVGCEPATLESVDGRMGLSEPVQTAVPEAINMVTELINRIREECVAAA